MKFPWGHPLALLRPSSGLNLECFGAGRVPSDSKGKCIAVGKAGKVKLTTTSDRVTKSVTCCTRKQTQWTSAGPCSEYIQDTEKTVSGNPVRKPAHPMGVKGCKITAGFFWEWKDSTSLLT